MTVILKYAWANAADARVGCAKLFGKALVTDFTRGTHGRSLLIPTWTTRARRQPINSIADEIGRSGLDRYTPRWVRMIASDSHFRYCPECMALGYQCVFFQIDAIKVCPIHSLPIVDSCRTCGHTTPRYAITQTALSTPFYCGSCGHPYGTSFSARAWRCPEFHLSIKAAFSPISEWLHRLEISDLKWPQWDDWRGVWLDDDELTDKRIATFYSLRKMIGDSPIWEGIAQNNCRVSVCGGLSRLVEIGVCQEEQDVRRSIYKSIRRRLVRHVKKNKDRRAFYLAPDDIGWVDDVIKLSLTRDLYWQTMMLWRLKFETSESMKRYGPMLYHSLTLRSQVVQGPWATSVNDSTWAQWVLLNFNAAAEMVLAWWKRAVVLAVSPTREQEAALYLEFASRLRPTKTLSSTQISIATLKQDQKTEREYCYVIGPAKQNALFIAGLGANRAC